MSSLLSFGKKDDATAVNADSKQTEQTNDGSGSKGGSSGAKKPEEKSEICTMKRGDYMIHVYIEQAKNIKVDAEDTVDPIVQIHCLDARKFTTA